MDINRIKQLAGMQENDTDTMGRQHGSDDDVIDLVMQLKGDIEDQYSVTMSHDDIIEAFEDTLEWLRSGEADLNNS